MHGQGPSRFAAWAQNCCQPLCPARLIRRRTLARSETFSDCFEAPSEKFIRILRWILSQPKKHSFVEKYSKKLSTAPSFCEFLLMQCVE
jgi:hypothetical protein